MTIQVPISRRLVLTVDRVRPTYTAGVRTTATATDLPAWIANRTRVVRDESGDRIASATIVYMEPDADVQDGDELIVDGKQRPIREIVPARLRTGEVHHLEVEMQ